MSWLTETTLDLEGLPLLRYHGSDRAEAHDFTEKDPGYRREGTEGDSTPSQVHAPCGSDSPGFEDIAENRHTDHAVLRSVRYWFGPAILDSLEMDDRKREQRERCWNENQRFTYCLTL